MADQRLEKEARRADIVEVARRLFAEDGYRSTTTRELARAAGVSDALLYRHFEGKEDVLRSVVDAGIAGFAQMRDVALADRDRPLAVRLESLGRAFLDVLNAQRDLLVLFVSEHRLLADDPRLARFIDLAARGLAVELAERAQAGEVREDLDGYVFARAFMGSLVAFVILQGTLGMDRIHPVDAEAYLAELVAVHVRGTTR